MTNTHLFFQCEFFLQIENGDVVLVGDHSDGIVGGAIQELSDVLALLVPRLLLP